MRQIAIEREGRLAADEHGLHESEKDFIKELLPGRLLLFLICVYPRKSAAEFVVRPVPL